MNPPPAPQAEAEPTRADRRRARPGRARSVLRAASRRGPGTIRPLFERSRAGLGGEASRWPQRAVVWAVAARLLRRTVRSWGWRIAAVAFVIGLYAVVLLVWAATRGSGGAITYGMTVSASLAVGLVALPVLGGTALSTDRALGVMDVIRATRIRAVELTLGLLIHLAVVSAVLVGVTVPLLLLAAAAGGVDLISVLLAPAVQWVTLSAMGALGLSVSAAARRPRHGVAAALLAATALVMGTVAAYATVLPLTQIEQDRRVQIDADPATSTDRPCTTVTRPVPTPRPELVWWLLAPNPVVIVADAAPAARAGSATFDPLGAISGAVRGARHGVADQVVQECWGGADPLIRPDVATGAAVWPWGLLALLALGAWSGRCVTRRLSVPGRERENRWVRATALAVGRARRRSPRRGSANRGRRHRSG